LDLLEVGCEKFLSLSDIVGSEGKEELGSSGLVVDVMGCCLFGYPVMSGLL
jgi:hypothetical protein